MTPAERPLPGRGAAHLELPHGAYVYAVRSRRSGGVSIGVDLTPAGACPLACDYCQVPRRERVTSIDRVELARLRKELSETFDDLLRRGERPVDVCFAGSGEPTWSPNFAAALEVAIDVAAGRVPVRVMTSGATLDWERVREPLAALVARGAGEVWVKLDAWDEATIARFWASRGQARHESRIERFSRTTPVMLQALVASRTGGPDEATTAAGLRDAIARLRREGAKIERVYLTTMHRPAGSADVHVRAYDDAALERVAAVIRETGVTVSVAFSAPREETPRSDAPAAQS
jgi:wyosine [tRNA(Phe)-imidazoG37] synthetase (radical SAM superfamily)